MSERNIYGDAVEGKRRGWCSNSSSLNIRFTDKHGPVWCPCERRYRTILLDISLDILN